MYTHTYVHTFPSGMYYAKLFFKLIVSMFCFYLIKMLEHLKFTFSKGPEIQESNKYWDAAENKPNVCGPCSHGTSISSARMWRKERERLGMRQQSIQFRRPNSAESTETTKNTPAATARPCQSPVKAAVLKGRPNAMSRLPLPCQDQEVHHGKSWVEASPRLL